MNVNVVYAIPQRFWSLELTVEDGLCVAEILKLAKQHKDFAEIIDVADESVAIWGVQVTQDHKVEDGDRVEILRPLAQHPMDRRRSLARDGA